MKTVKALYTYLNTEKDFKKKYPGYNPDDGKVHVLFLSACSNESSYYRLILPALELNRTDTHAAIISDIHKWDFNKLFDDYDNPIDYRLVKWADYVVMPVLFTDVEYIIRNMREINSDIEFVMDVDQNYHELPDYHPDYRKLRPDLKDTLLGNFFKVDILTAPNSAILNYYGHLAEQNTEEMELYLERYNNLLSNFTFDEISGIQRNQNERVRIGLILDPSQVNDLKTIEPALVSLHNTFKEKIELVIYGWNEKIAEQNSLLKDLPVTYERPVPFFDYHNKLNSLALDIGLLPFVNNAFNVAGKAWLRYLDFSANMVPVIAPAMNPFNRIITEGENGFIAASEEEWAAKVSQLIENTEQRQKIGSYAHKFVWENYSYNPKAIQRLRSVFI